MYRASPLIKESRERVELVWSAGDAGVDGDMKQSTSSAMTVGLCYGPQAASSHEMVQQEQQRTQQKYLERTQQKYLERTQRKQRRHRAPWSAGRKC
jgi:hypothetical protein